MERAALKIQILYIESFYCMFMHRNGARTEIYLQRVNIFWSFASKGCKPAKMRLYKKGITVILTMKPIFEYDPEKNKRNKEKHGVDLLEAQALWDVSHVVVHAKTVGGEARYAIL